MPKFELINILSQKQNQLERQMEKSKRADKQSSNCRQQYKASRTQSGIVEKALPNTTDSFNAIAYRYVEPKSHKAIKKKKKRVK